MTSDQLKEIADKFGVQITDEHHEDGIHDTLGMSVTARYFTNVGRGETEFFKTNAKQKILTTVAHALVNHGRAMLEEIRRNS